MELTRANIYIDEGQFYWVGDFTLADYLEGADLEVDSPVNINMNGEVYNFLVDSKTVDRNGPGNYQVTLSCVSPSARLTAPRALPITKTWPSTTARAICEEVLDGWSLDWRILDWPLPAGRFAVSEKTPIEIVRQLVEVVGALVEAEINGDLVVRYKFPISTNLYETSTPDAEFTDDDDIFSSSEGLKAQRVFDKFRVMSSDDAEGSDRLEFEDLGAGNGEIRAYPAPWRTNVNLIVTRSSVTIGPQAYEEREEIETIEILNNLGTVRYPVLSIVSHEWLDMGSGGISSEVGLTAIRSADTTPYGLLKVTYKVRSLLYNVHGTVGDQAQFLLEEVDG